MSQIHILLNTGSAQGNLVFSGIYGGVSGDGIFTPAPEFDPISHLFGLVKNGAVAIPGDVMALDAPDSEVSVICAQLMDVLGRRWRTMYAEVSPSREGLMAAMLQAEEARVEAGVNSYLRTAGMTTWLVPITANVYANHVGASEVAAAQERGHSASNFLKGHLATGTFSDVAIDDRLPPGGLGFLMTGTSHSELEERGEPLTDEALPEWCAPEFWGGIVASVECVIDVPARTAEEAIVAANWRLKFDKMGVIASLALRVNNVRALRPFEPNDNDLGELDPDGSPYPRQQ